MTTLSYVGYILVLIGGILLVVFGLIAILSSPLYAFSPLTALGNIGSGIVGIVIGIICIIGARYVGTLAWAIVLLILGIIAAGPGSILVVLGALLGLVSALTHHHNHL